MKVNLIKGEGNSLIPADEFSAEYVKKLAREKWIECEIKQPRNYQFHKKVFSLMLFCFEYWSAENAGLDTLTVAAQFDVFRKHLTCLAGHYESLYNIKGEVRIEAKSISYAKMNQSDFEQFYSSLVNAALKHVFKTTDENTMNKLMGFL